MGSPTCQYSEITNLAKNSGKKANWLKNVEGVLELQLDSHGGVGGGYASKKHAFSAFPPDKMVSECLLT